MQEALMGLTYYVVEKTKNAPKRLSGLLNFVEAVTMLDGLREESPHSVYMMEVAS